MPAESRIDGVGAQDEALAQEALRDMGVYCDDPRCDGENHQCAARVEERQLTAPGERPDGDGWECIASGVCPDRSTGAWWLWQRFVEEGS